MGGVAASVIIRAQTGTAGTVGGYNLRPLCSDSVEKVRKLKSRETIGRALIVVCKNDSRQRLSLNQCFVPETIAPAEPTFSTESAISGRHADQNIWPLHTKRRNRPLGFFGRGFRDEA